MTGFDSKRQMAQAKPKAQSDLIKRLRDTASKGVSVWGDLQMAAAREIEILTAERECYARVLAAQPQRQWVGLTDEEWEPLYDKLAKYQEYGAFVSGWDNFARAIEAKLKEKNDY